MAISKKMVNEKHRQEMIDFLIKTLSDVNYEIMQTATNELAIPFVNDLQEELYFRLTIAIPTGSRDGIAYDGHELAETYKMTVEQNKKEAEEKEKAKQKKIKRDAEMRELKKKKEEEKKEIKNAGSVGGAMVKKMIEDYEKRGK